MTSHIGTPSFTFQLGTILLSAIAQLVLLRLGFTVDLLLSTLLIFALIGSFEAILIGGFLGYILLFGPLGRLELIYLLVVPLISGYFGRQFLGLNVTSFIAVTVFGSILFYGLIDLGAIASAPWVWAGSLVASLLWVVGIYFYLSSQRSIAG